MRGGGRFRDIRSPRSREDRAWKYIEKIPIDESAFPPNVKPAAIIIGVKGSNHTRMQDEAGCCVQLRGRGISSPGTPGADEPIHLWVKYDTTEQLQKVHQVLQEIIRSCENGPPPELRKKATVVPGSSGTPPPANIVTPAATVVVPQQQIRPPMRPPPVGVRPRPFMLESQVWPNSLPPMPLRPPDSPLECFFTIHYIAHARPDITTQGFEQAYESFFGFPLEARLKMLGGSLVASFTRLPQIIKLEDVKTGLPPPPDPVQAEGGLYYIRPVLPMGMTWNFFHSHVTSQHAGHVQPPPPPPPTVMPPVRHPSVAPATPPMVDVRHLGGHEDFQSKDVIQNLPSPVSLVVQALHAILADMAFKSVEEDNSPPLLCPETLKRWPGVPVAEVEDLFARELGLKLDTEALGFCDTAR